MGNALAGGIYIIATTKHGKTEYWAAATVRGNAVNAVEQMLGPGWTATLTDRRLAPEKVRALKLLPNGVCQLKEAP